MARIPKHILDINEYKSKLENQYSEVLKKLEGSVAEISDAKSYYANPDDIDHEATQYIRVIDATNLKIACDDMKRLMDSIKMKFTKKD